jgi:hypothetical protein
MTSDWAHCLSKTLLNKDCAIVGSKIIPRWYKKPHWYMKSNIMTDQYSLLDCGPNEKEIDRVIGGSLGINLRQMDKEAYFDNNLGRRNGKLLGGIDSEFCERAIEKGFKVYYCGCTIAQHQILESKMTLSWTINKFYYSGYSRAIRGGRPSSMNKKREIVDCFILGLFAIFYITGLLAGSLNKQNMEKP